MREAGKMDGQIDEKRTQGTRLLCSSDTGHKHW